MPFLGRQSVLATLLKQQRTAKVTSGTLKVRADGDTFINVTWANMYVWPDTVVTGVGSGGFPDAAGRATLYRIGEDYGPKVDDKLADSSGRTWQIVRVESRLNGDESEGFAVYDCELV